MKNHKRFYEGLGRPVLCISVVALLLGVIERPNLGALQSVQDQTPAPPTEVKTPIISMMIASSIDEKGKLVNPVFTFPQTEPQITAVVWVGQIRVSQLKVTWYQTSEDGDEKLFEHQIQVKSDDCAFSVARNPGPLFLAGTYKVVATLEGQTQEIEFDISPRKTAPKKTSNSRGDEPFEDQARSQSIHGPFSMVTNGLLAANKSELVASVGGNIQKLLWNADSRTEPATQSGSAAAQGKPPMAGSSGTAPQPRSAPRDLLMDCKVFIGAFGDLNNPIWKHADLVKVSSWAICSAPYIARTSTIPHFEVSADLTPLGGYLAGVGVAKGGLSPWIRVTFTPAALTFPEPG